MMSHAFQFRLCYNIWWVFKATQRLDEKFTACRMTRKICPIKEFSIKADKMGPKKSRLANYQGQIANKLLENENYLS